MIRTLVIAPYLSLRAELESLLTDAEECIVVGAFSGSEDIAPLLTDLAVQVMVIDGSEEQEERKRLLALASQYELGVVLLDDLEESVQQMAVSEVAAWAVLRHDIESQELAAALCAVNAGLVVVDRTLIALLNVGKPSSARVSSPHVPSVSGAAFLPSETLTGREREVLQLMAQGLANKQIGGKLSISLHTVKFHVASILAKFGASSRTEAVTLGARRGLVTL